MFDLAPSDIVTRYRLTRHDEIVMAGVSYVVTGNTPNGYLMKRLDETGLAFELRHEDISRRAGAGQLTVNHGRFLPEEARKRAGAPVETIASLNEKARERAQYRNAIVQAAIDLRRKGVLKMTDESIQQNKHLIAEKAKPIFLELRGEKRGYAGARSEPAMDFSPRSLRTWMSAFETFGVAGLVDRRNLSGRRRDVLGSETQAVLADGVRRYATMNQPSKRKVADDIERLFEALNQSREADGRAPLHVPTRSRIMRAIDDLSPFAVATMRHGAEAARKRFAPVGPGIEVSRPLERVEIDEWRIDLKTLLEVAGLEHRLTPAEKAALDLDNKKAFYWVTVAIDVRTRCILAMRLSRSPSSSVAVEALEMILRDKGVFADAVGALSPWDMHGLPELIVTDCGQAFKSLQFMGAANDLGIRIERTPGGRPHLRGTIERVFRTIGADLLPRLHGFSFSSLCKRGDHDPDKQAVLTAEELCFALTRWVVDVYHRSGHDGLNGETPLDAWRRLTAEYAVLPPPDMRRRRHVFGSHLKRLAGREGVVVLGVQYHCETLARWYANNRDRAVQVRWYAEDIGAVSVRLGDEWIEVPATDRGFAGVRAQNWLAAVAAQRAVMKRQAALSRDVVFKALADIEAMNAEAAARAGLVAQDWSEERIAHEEEKLFIGFRLTEARIEAAVSIAPGRWGEALPIAGEAGAAVVIDNTAHAPVSVPAEANAVPPHEPQSDGRSLLSDAGGAFGFEDK